jgi:hypothetical protein
MTRQEVIQLADRVAAVTPDMIWFVVYRPASNSYQVMPHTELRVSGKLTEAMIVHVAEAAVLSPLPPLGADR